MKALLLLFVFGLASTHAATLDFNLSPPGTDNAVGMSPQNEVPPATNSIGSGNEIGPGITFDTQTLQLNLAIGYGSAFGFDNLTGPITGVHIHGPALTNAVAPILINLASNSVPLADPTNGGVIVGTVQLTTDQASNLMAGLCYINLHTAANPAGEIRGQLIPVNTLPTMVCPDSVVTECKGTNGTFVHLTAQVSDADGDALTVVWTVNGVDFQTNDVPAGDSINPTDVVLEAYYPYGTNLVQIAVSDGMGSPVTCETTVAVVDTRPPTIESISASPDVLWPPNHKFKPVTISVVASDSCDPNPTCRITSISSNEPTRGKGDNTSPDWVITGDLTAMLRAERLGRGDGRVYTITVICTDESGNSTNREVTVTVPHDQGKKKQPKSKSEPGPTNEPGSKSHGRKS